LWLIFRIFTLTANRTVLLVTHGPARRPDFWARRICVDERAPARSRDLGKAVTMRNRADNRPFDLAVLNSWEMTQPCAVLIAQIRK